ncbi:hypothetical protein J2S90_003288 [Arthrobacter bambusae]|uniref:DNA modification methylase n=2 Tax=Arthrobacter bambusae TaxID=1338426 RepID=A0AAW8DKQ6_9MICC|nr:hypothetical protein [Arthrobacter bambusae]MDQ0130458.1 hypothetical protein [Arthrobacter bambusae]MDQ0183398.1 hypothetical protein [Arthrobacter bambusae]
MRITAMNRVQRGKLAMAAAAISIGLLSVTGCGYINPQQTNEQYSPSDGVREDLGSLQLRNMLIVSTDANKPGRVIGAVFNTSSSDATLTISGAGGSQATIPVKAKSQTYLNENTDPAILSTSGGAPGSMVSVTIKTGSDSRTVQFPVLDASLKEYSKYLPTVSASPSPSVSGSATPSSSATSGTSATPSASATGH